MTIMESIKAIIDEAEAMRGAYYFNPPKAAGSRRSYEKAHSHPEITWEEGGHTYTAAFTVSCSCSNVYATGHYARDGEKTTLTAIKNSYKRLTNA